MMRRVAKGSVWTCPQRAKQLQKKSKNKNTEKAALAGMQSGKRKVFLAKVRLKKVQLKKHQEQKKHLQLKKQQQKKHRFDGEGKAIAKKTVYFQRKRNIK